MIDTLYWTSNNQRVADREFFTGRVRNGQLEIVTDTKVGTWVPVYLKKDVVENTAPTSIDQVIKLVVGDPPS
jgi:hypothetical protein